MKSAYILIIATTLSVADRRAACAEVNVMAPLCGENQSKWEERTMRYRRAACRIESILKSRNTDYKIGIRRDGVKPDILGGTLKRAKYRFPSSRYSTAINQKIALKSGAACSAPSAARRCIEQSTDAISSRPYKYFLSLVTSAGLACGF